MSEVSGVNQSGDHSPGASSQPGVGFAEPGAGEIMKMMVMLMIMIMRRRMRKSAMLMMRVKTGGGDNSYLVFSEIRGTPLHSDFTL